MSGSIFQGLGRCGLRSAIRLEDLDSLRAQYAAAKPLWVKVSILRNKVYRHRALDVDIEEAFDEAGVTPFELRDLVSQTKRLLNDLNLKLRDSTHAFNLSATRDTVRLLEDLKNK